MNAFFTFKYCLDNKYISFLGIFFYGPKGFYIVDSLHSNDSRARMLIQKTLPACLTISHRVTQLGNYLC